VGITNPKRSWVFNEGFHYIVDIDLKSFFDEVNHDYMMNLIKRKVKDPQVLRLIWRYLRSPILITTITLDCLKRRGYISFLEYYLDKR